MRAKVVTEVGGFEVGAREGQIPFAALGEGQVDMERDQSVLMA